MAEGKLKTHDPSYDARTKTFIQTMTFTADQRINEHAIQVVLSHALKLFEGSLVMNDLLEFSWPPDEVHVEPHEDFRGAAFLLATRADKRKVIVIN
jgi:hypothetical protein